MGIGLKIVIALGLAVAVLLACGTAVVGSAAVAGGVASVSVRSSDGPSLRLAVPGVLITGAAAACARLGERPLRVELGDAPHLATAARQAVELLATLEDIPDATLVEVEDGADRVRIVKRGRSLRVWVIDGGGDLDLEVSVPIHAARRAAAHLLG